MKIWNVLKSKLISSKFKEIQKQNKILMDGILRPSAGRGMGYWNQSPFLYPTFPYNRWFLYEFSYASDTLTSVHNALRRELFRNGYELAEAKDTKDEQQSSEAETVPKGKTQEEILEFLESINENQQSIIDVCMELEDDFSIVDNAFMVFLFEYIFDNNGELKTRELKQVLRGDPRYMGPVLNKYDRPAHDDNDTPYFFCPEHRDQLYEGKDICKCGKKCWRAFYFKDYDGQKLYYARWEVVFKSKYRPSIRGGFPPSLAVWQKVRTLMFMDKYIMEMYDGQRPPKHGLFFKTSNTNALYEMLDKAKQKTADDPHWPLMLAVPDSTNGKEFVQFIDFMKSLDELQHTEMRNEYRRQIGAVYGVEPIFQGDQSQSGGLNNEGLQITVTNRAVEYGQAIFNNHFFTELLKAMGTQGFDLTLNPSEEQDEMAKLTRQAQTLANGQLALNLGLEASYDEETGEVIIKPGDLEQEETEFDESPFGRQPASPPRVSGSPPIGGKSEFKTLLSKARNRPSFSKLSDTLKKQIDKFVKIYKRKPTEEQLKKAIAKINLNLQKELKNSTGSLFKNTYLNEMNKVEGELGINVLFDTVDQNALVALSSQDVLTKAYSGIASNLTNKLNGIIQQAYREPEGLSTQKITEKIKDLVDVSDFRAETIARTETSKVSSAARKNSYSKEEGFDEFLFKWIGPTDSRTTDTSKRIKSRTKDGVPWTELIKVIEEESARDYPEWTVDKDFPVSHYNSRHTFIKIPGTINKRNESIIRDELQKQEDKKLEENKKLKQEELEMEFKKKELKVLQEKEDLINNLKNGK